MMLTIYRGRESLHKEKFIYGKIKSNRPSEEGFAADRNIVIVPDQYTLVAERQALACLDEEVLLDIEVTGISRLGTRLLEESGKGSLTVIDKYGRHMLIARVLSEKADELEVFRGSANKEGFLASMNDFISHAKQYGMTPDSILANIPSDELLEKKLKDLSIIFSAYEEKLSGKYTDGEDLLSLYKEAAETSEIIKKSHIWIYGFDSFTPKNIEFIGALMGRAKSVNIFLTHDESSRDEDLFRLTEIVTSRILSEADKHNVEAKVVKVDPKKLPKGAGDISLERPEGVKTIERELYAIGTGKESDAAGVKVVKCANVYYEAEAAAAEVLDLLMYRGMRLRDIVILCNDQEIRASIISRVFGEYDMNLFTDRKREVISSPLAVYVVSLIDTAVFRNRTEDIMRVLKTGLGDFTEDEISRLENYVMKYKVRGSMWEKPFTKGSFEYDQEELDEINTIRERTEAILSGFRRIYDASKTYGEFVRALYEFMANDQHIPEKLRLMSERQRTMGLSDSAEETAQIWDLMMQAFSQLAEIMDDEAFSGKDFSSMLRAGLSQMEVGVLPPTPDDIMLGTMQRTRFGDVKAVLCLGGNEGILPRDPGEDVLFSREELEAMRLSGNDMGLDSDIRAMEEDLAIYRCLSSPEKELYISYSITDEAGNEIRPSSVVDKIRRIFPDLPVKDDPITLGDYASVLGGKVNTLRHYTGAMRRAMRERISEPIWHAVEDWLGEREPGMLSMVKNELGFSNEETKLPDDMAGALYLNPEEGRTEYSVSPSRLEKFSRCPFSHFISYGLRPEELRTYEISGRELGDLYHNVLMEYCELLSREKTWDSIEREESDKLVTDIVERISAGYRDGLFLQSNDEKYWKSRAIFACREVCWNLALQIRAGTIDESLYEVSFGRRGKLPPIVKETAAGGKVYIEGKIDRLDILPGGMVKIIDYKTGKEEFKKKEAEAGYRLQLMLYLKAAQEETRKPAGVFYFLIADPKVPLDDVKESDREQWIESKIKKEFKLNGVMVDSPEAIKSIAGEFTGFSDILPLRMNKEGEIKGTGKEFLLSEEEFSDLQKTLDAVTDELCENLIQGHLEIRPKKTKTTSACAYCGYKGICRFDPGYKGNKYEYVDR